MSLSTMHPNEHCCPTSWDQRIPNEPLLERNFLIERPPIIPQDSPRTSDRCAATDRPWLLMDRAAEKAMMMYWYNFVINDNSNKQKSKSLRKMIIKYPGRPWLHGIRKNIERDSHLSNRNYYNPKDCIIDSVQHDLHGLNRLADDVLYRQMSQGNKRQDCNIRLWNQPTTARMTEPIDFAYEPFLRSCISRPKEPTNSY